MFKPGYIELNEFIKKHYGITNKKNIHSKRTTIVKLIHRRNKEELLLEVNTTKVVIESEFYKFLSEEQSAADEKNANMTCKWRLLNA